MEILITDEKVQPFLEPVNPPSSSEWRMNETQRAGVEERSAVVFLEGRGCQLRGPHNVTEAEPCKRL